MRSSSLIALTALFSITTGFAASPEPVDGEGETWKAESEARLRPVIEALTKQTDADALAAAALLSYVSQREQSLRWIAQASLVAPKRADLLWLHIQFCQADDSCNPEPLENRLKSLDPKNGAGWLGALARAGKRKDETAQLTALAAIAGTERVDIYWTTLIARLTHAVASTHMLPPIDAEVPVIGVLAAMPIPAYTAMTVACRGERLTRDGALEACRGVAVSLMKGDTVIAEGIGTTIAKLAWPENSPKWLEASEARRVLDYRVRFTEAVFPFAEHAGDYLAFFEQHHREQDVFGAALIAGGKNPDPPPQDQSPERLSRP